MEDINVIIEHTNSIVQLQIYKILIDIKIKELNGLNKNDASTARKAV